MENKKERVLAYTVAAEISNEDLAKVSGGAANMTTRATFQPTGSSGQGPDVAIDVTADW